MSTELTTTEANRLALAEAVIERGQQTFIEVGNALSSIRDERLYRQKYETFETYCQARWGFTGRRAEQLMQAAVVVNELSLPSEKSEQLFASKKAAAEPKPLPQTESQARELAAVAAEKRAETWNKAVETAPKDEKTGEPKVTAAHVRSVVKAATKPKSAASKPKPTPKPEPVKVTPAEPKAHPWDDFNSQVDDLVSELRSVHSRLSKLIDFDPDTKRGRTRWAEGFRRGSTTDHINAAIYGLRDDRVGRLDKTSPKGFLTIKEAKHADDVAAALKRRKAG